MTKTSIDALCGNWKADGPWWPIWPTPIADSRNPSDNKTDAHMAMAELHHRFPYVAFINPLDNFRAIDGEEYEAILFLCKQMISRCDLVIFAGDRAAIADSRGCAEEFAAARYAHGIPCFHFDKDGLFYPMFDFKFW